MSYQVPDKTALLIRAANRMATNPMFMGWVLSADHNGVFDLGEIASTLGVDPQSILSLALCQRPRKSAEHFVADVRAIAATSRIAPETVAAVVRRVDAIAAMRSGGASRLMAAAQDDIDSSSPPPTTE